MITHSTGEPSRSTEHPYGPYYIYITHQATTIFWYVSLMGGTAVNPLSSQEYAFGSQVQAATASMGTPSMTIIIPIMMQTGAKKQDQRGAVDIL